MLSFVFTTVVVRGGVNSSGTAVSTMCDLGCSPTPTHFSAAHFHTFAAPNTHTHTQWRDDRSFHRASEIPILHQQAKARDNKADANARAGVSHATSQLAGILDAPLYAIGSSEDACSSPSAASARASEGALPWIHRVIAQLAPRCSPPTACCLPASACAAVADSSELLPGDAFL